MTRFLDTADGHRIAFHHSEGHNKGMSPGILFLGGFKSDMNGTKAQALQKFCDQRNRQYTRFDYLGHGESSGTFCQGTIGRWLQDSLEIIDNITDGPQILVGSSMGGWLMLLCALSRPERICGLLGIASAADFSERLIWASLDKDEREKMIAAGSIGRPSDYQEDPYIITWSFIQEAREHLLLDNAIAVDVPVCLIHGQRDPDVPWQTSMEIAQKLDSDDVSILLIKDGDHRLSSPAQLKVICDQLQNLIDRSNT